MILLELNLLPDQLQLLDKMRKLLIVIALVSLFGSSKMIAQQVPHYTQFMFNNYAFNPAIAGTHNYYQIRLNSRFQWVGITDPPQTNSLSVYGPHASKDMGFGGHLYTDVTGPSSRTGVYGSYSYNLVVNDLMRLSMGLSFGLIQNKIDGTSITLLDPNDPALLGSSANAFVPDASFGLFLYSSDFHVGFSVSQLFNNKLNFYDGQVGINKLKSHFYLTGGYKYRINHDFAVEPSIIIKGTTPVPLQVDFNVRGIYQEMVWLGLSIRSQDAFSILLGYMHENKFIFGYSYDISVSDIRKFNSGSHEILLGMRFNAIKK